MGGVMGTPVEGVARVIQVALTPVFLLSGIGTVLNVLTTRVARVTDHLEHLAELLEEGGSTPVLRAHIRRLRRRVVALDLAVAMGVAGAAATCGATFALFVGALRDETAATYLFVLFGAAILFTLGALAAFLFETVQSWDGIQSEGPLPRPKRVGRV